MKIETVKLQRGKMTVIELSKNQALILAQDLIKQVNGNFNSEEFKIEDGHYLRMAVNRVQDHIRAAISYLVDVLPQLSKDEQQSIICDLSSGNEASIWNTYNRIRLIIERARSTQEMMKLAE